jgi:hypothetical protein
MFAVLAEAAKSTRTTSFRQRGIVNAKERLLGGGPSDGSVAKTGGLASPAELFALGEDVRYSIRQIERRELVWSEAQSFDHRLKHFTETFSLPTISVARRMAFAARTVEPCSASITMTMRLGFGG